MTLTCAVRLRVYCAEAGLRVGADHGQKEERAQRQQQPRPRHLHHQPGSVRDTMIMCGLRQWCGVKTVVSGLVSRLVSGLVPRLWCQDFDVKTGVKTVVSGLCRVCLCLVSRLWSRRAKHLVYLDTGAEERCGPMVGRHHTLNQPPCPHLPPPGRRQPPYTGHRVSRTLSTSNENVYCWACRKSVCNQLTPSPSSYIIFALHFISM